MSTDNILRTYGDVAIKEDVVLNAIEILTATEDQIFNIIGRAKAIAVVHNYLTDTLQDAASGAVTEGGDYDADALSTPSRLTNLVQHIAKPFKVTRTQQVVEHYHGQNEKERQTTKALKNWGNSAEFDLIRSTLVSGVSGTVPKMSRVLTQYFNGDIIKKIIKFLNICQSVKLSVNIVKLNLRLMMMQNIALVSVGN